MLFHTSQTMTLSCASLTTSVSRQRWSQAAFFRNLARDGTFDVVLPDDMLLSYHVMTRNVIAAIPNTLGEVYSLRDDLLFLGVDPMSRLAGDFSEMCMRFVRSVNVTSELYCLMRTVLDVYTNEDVKAHPMMSLFYPSRLRTIIFASLVPLEGFTVDLRHSDVVRRVMTDEVLNTGLEKTVRLLIERLSLPGTNDTMSI